MSVVLVHIGNSLPDYIIDCIYQLLLVNIVFTLYIILSPGLIPSLDTLLNGLNCSYNNVKIIDASSLNIESTPEYIQYQKIVSRYNLDSFRDSFWLHTTSRFFYIKGFVKDYKIDSIFHIENDVMVYIPFKDILNSLQSSENCIFMARDSPNRVIPSIMFFTKGSANNLINHIVNTLAQSNVFINDMALLASYKDLKELPVVPTLDSYIYDGAAIGQYLGGIDYKNISSQEDELIKYNNPSRGFINETYNIKDLKILKSSGFDKAYKVTSNKATSLLANLHIHSKQLHEFSSVFDILYTDIISGDRVMDLCDYILTTREIDEFHQNITHLGHKKIFLDQGLTHDLNNKKVFIYNYLLTFLIDDFPILDSLTLYTHNGDDEFTEDKYLALSKKVKNLTIYAQNVNCNLRDNVKLLPIGIANSMWKHGSLLNLYKEMKNSYLNKKTNNLFVCLNENTYKLRAPILALIPEDIKIHKDLDPESYIKAMSKYYFCLCIRGNGIDTHRFWEALYLGTIPVLISTAETNCENFIKYLERLDVPFLVLRIENKFKYTNDYFNSGLYYSILNKKHIGLCSSLKLNYYK